MASTLAAAGCSTEPSCDSVCDNFLDLCVGADADDADRNACMEGCTGTVNDIPSACGTAKDDTLVCLADAESLECSNALNSASCEAEVTKLYECLVKEGSGTGSAGSGPAPGNPTPEPASGGGGTGGAAPQG